MTGRSVEPVLAALYVPGDRPERFAGAAASGADVVVIDLEDAVVAEHKAAARAFAMAWLTVPHPVRTEVRVNADPRWAAADLRALGEIPTLAAVRVPKVESAADVHAALDALGPDTPTTLTVLVESARGLEAAFDIARADPRVTAIAPG